MQTYTQTSEANLSTISWGMPRSARNACSAKSGSVVLELLRRNGVECAAAVAGVAMDWASRDTTWMHTSPPALRAFSWALWRVRWTRGHGDMRTSGQQSGLAAPC